ncbi:MAG: BTAD domain-containing putative transcriptional regulator, partial [Actinoplanes sp.]
MTEQELRVHVLGGAELAVDGRPLAELASAKAAALLFYLALTGAGHSRTALAGLLWSDLPESTARANLRLVLTKLRRVVPEHVVVTRQTVALAVGRFWVDAAEVGRVARTEQDDAVLLAAVRLCRGDLLPGFGVPGAPVFDEWLAGRRATVRADMLALLDRAVQRAWDRRDAAVGTEAARRLLELEPLHEEAHRALMWFLAVGGQRSAALAQFETCRYLLREELGVEPSPTTIALRDEIAGTGGFTELGSPPGVAGQPDRHGAGGPAASDLPRPLTTLIGRERELARLHELLDDPACRLVTLVGPGGIGKTRLAVEVAAARRSEHRDGTVFVSFVGAPPALPAEAADLIVADLARALDVPLALPRDPLDLVGDHLTGRELLLVLDNLEHLRDGAGVLAELLRRAPGVRVLVTSRRQLGLGVEWLFEVPGLPYPPLGADADAADYPAVQLFEERARLLRPGLRAAGGTPAAGRVCRLVAGVPLAIELAARWTRSASPAAIAERLDGGLDLLVTTAPDVERRHRSLRSVIDWSYQLLTDAERGALRRLSVLRGGFDLAAAAAVADAGLPLLAGLVDQSLVAIGEGGRYGMHELLRQYAAERLATDPAEESQTRRRQAEHYASLLPEPVDAQADGGPGLAVEAENLRTATDWLIQVADPVALDAHLFRVWALYRRMGWFREAQAFLGAALERPDITPLQRARWHRRLGEAHQQLGEALAARYHLERALEVLGRPVPASTVGWLGLLAAQVATRTLRGLLRPGGAAERRADRREAARECAATSFAIAEVYWMLEIRLPVVPASIRALNDAERAGDLNLVVRAHAGVGMTVGTLGLRRLARRHLNAANAAVGRTSDPLTVCWVSSLGGLHWAGVGDWAAVDESWARVRELQRRAPMHRWADEALLIGGNARYLTARYPEAADAATEGLASGRHRCDPVVQFWSLVMLIEIGLRTDPDDPALAVYCDAAQRLLPKVAGIDAARLHATTARRHLAADRPADAWQAIRTVDRLVGARPTVEQYAIEALAGVPEVCLTLLELAGSAGSVRGAGDPDPADLRTMAAAALRRLGRYARRVPMARPRALICLGWYRWLDGRPGAARRAWVRAIREAERLRM